MKKSSIIINSNINKYTILLVREYTADSYNDEDDEGEEEEEKGCGKSFSKLDGTQLL